MMDRDRATEPLVPEKSLGELLGDLTSDLGLLFRQEVELAKTEASDELKQAGRGAGMLAGAGLSAWMALLLLSLALAWLLDKKLDRGLLFAIVGVISGAIAVGTRRARQTRNVGCEAVTEDRSDFEGGCAMGQDTDELKRDIEDTRGGMTETLDAIGDRVSPGRIVERRKNRIRASVHDLRDRVMGSASDAQHGVTDAAHGAADAVKHTPDAIGTGTQGAPLMAGAIAFGAGFLVAAVFSPTETEKKASAKVMQTLEPAKEQLVDSAKEVADHLKEPAKQAAQDIKDTAGESAAAVASTARDAADEAKQKASDAVEAVKSGEPTATNG